MKFLWENAQVCWKCEHIFQDNKSHKEPGKEQDFYYYGCGIYRRKAANWHPKPTPCICSIDENGNGIVNTMFIPPSGSCPYYLEHVMVHQNES